MTQPLPLAEQALPLQQEDEEASAVQPAARSWLPPFHFSPWVGRIIDFLTPKDPNLYLVEQTGHGDVDAVVAEIRKRYPQARVVEFNLQKYLKRLRPRAIDYYRAKTLILSISPGCYKHLTFSKRKTVIQLWHGNPLKSLGYAKPKHRAKMYAHHRRCRAFIVSSKLEAAMFSHCFAIPAPRLHLLGRARNDVLVNPPSPLPTIESYTGPLPPYEKVVLMCPTWRNKRFDRRSRLFLVDDFDPVKVNRFLERRRAVLLIRGHYFRNSGERPTARHDPAQEKAAISHRIFSLGFDVCPFVYPLLHRVDALVTDYSSIYSDFLLLNRPLVFVPYDMDDYRKTQGLLYDDYDFWTPGPKARNLEEMLAALDLALTGDDGYEPQRLQINRLFNSHQYRDTPTRICRLIERYNFPKSQREKLGKEARRSRGDPLDVYQPPPATRTTPSPQRPPTSSVHQ